MLHCLSICLWVFLLWVFHFHLPNPVLPWCLSIHLSSLSFLLPFISPFPFHLGGGGGVGCLPFLESPLNHMSSFSCSSRFNPCPISTGEFMMGKLLRECKRHSSPPVGTKISMMISSKSNQSSVQISPQCCPGLVGRNSQIPDKSQF